MNVKANRSGPSFKYADLFAGVGGFAAALNALGGKHSVSAEKDEEAARTYLANFYIDPTNDVREIANDKVSIIYDVDVVAGGFPCQPFSKSGIQAGTLDKVRGTLFENIIHFVKANRPLVVCLENVRNLVGPRHIEDFQEIIFQLRCLGYRVSDDPAVISPHLLPRGLGGRPQYRPRVYIAATYNPSRNSSESWETPTTLSTQQNLVSKFGAVTWNVMDDLGMEGLAVSESYALSSDELRWLETWDSFLRAFLANNGRSQLPGFPLWSDVWFKPGSKEFAGERRDWKVKFIAKNKEFYIANRTWIDEWHKNNPSFDEFPHSRRKFEWQAGQAKSIWKCAIQFRPSGVRVKHLNHLPALVAINQSSIIGPLKRRVSISESAKLQGFPFGFDLSKVPTSEAYKQMGNAVHIGSVYYILKQLIQRDGDVLAKSKRGRDIVAAISQAPDNPDKVFETWNGRVTVEQQPRQP